MYETTNPPLEVQSYSKSRTAEIFTVRNVGIFFLGLLTGWGALNISGALNSSSPFSFSAIAAVVGGLGDFFANNEAFTITPSNSLPTSGDLFTLVIKNADKRDADGQYTLGYPCVSAMKLERFHRNAVEELSCGQRTILGRADLTGVTLRITHSASTTLDVPITLFFEESNNGAEEPLFAQTLVIVAPSRSIVIVAESASTSAAKNSIAGAATAVNSVPRKIPSRSNNAARAAAPTDRGAVVTVPATVGAPKAGTKTEKTVVYYSTGPTSSNPDGVIDLEARILEIGYVDKATNVFTASSSPSANLRVAVRFEVISKGTKASGSWSFNAVLPTLPFHIYSGDSQLSLMPSEKIEFVLGFDSIERKKDAEFIVNVDPTGRVVESDESNNIVKVMIHPAF
ncbi:MAG: hypothetical protein UY62_C0072G0003 [Parcubacteria group bacterium GW2011_GWF2_50_9]|nr:MAG: hypothetical protein UY62_C0072G0003 [Parcubacteria group bacterium GW2011_GWF2_50_9]